MGFRFSEPYYRTGNQAYFLGSGGAPALVPALFEVALGGHPYRIDFSANPALRQESVPYLRQQQDQSDAPGEQSINPEAFWRRTAESWHLGTGQDHFDRTDSEPFRFRDSLGVDPWTKWELSLLPESVSLEASAATNLDLAVAGDHLYTVNGAELAFRTSLAGAKTPADFGATPPADAVDIASSGFHVWTAHGADGIWRTTRGAAASASHITGTVILLGFARNRLIATDATNVYDVSVEGFGSGGPLPAPLFTHDNSDWEWVGIAEGVGHIYLAGRSGDKSLIYKLGLTQDGTQLDVPIVAGQLLDGEQVQSIKGYLGRFLFVGVQDGWRLAVVLDGGDLQIGAKVETPMPVLDFEGEEEFVWYGGASGTDTNGQARTGLGRLSTNNFTDIDNLVPAYANDVMTDGTANTRSVVTFEGRRVFAVDQVGFFHDGDDKVASGHIDSGLITYNMTDPKLGLWIQTDFEGGEKVDLDVSTDEGPFSRVATAKTSVDASRRFGLGEVTASTFEVRLVLHRDDVTLTEGAMVRSWLLRVQPVPDITNLIWATVFLAPNVETRVDTPFEYKVFEEIDFIRRLNKSKQVTTWNMGRIASSVIVDDYSCDFERILHGQEGYQGANASCLLKLKLAD